MTICCISDTHGRHDQLDLSDYPADVLVHAGDFTGRDTKTQIIHFLEWLDVQDHGYKILICGNHERLVENDPNWFYVVLLHFPSITYLQDSSVTIDGVKFHGSPYSNEFCNWAFMGDELELSKVWAKIPDDTNVLITHGPAYGCNDLVKRSYGGDPHVGSQSLHHRKLALQDSLKVHVSGHIHEAYNVDTTGKCIDICASILDEKYQLANKPIVVEI